MKRLIVPLVLLFVTVMSSGCPARPPVTSGADRCTVGASRCSTAGRPEICSGSHRWQPTDDEACPTGSACCLVTSLEGGQIHACAPADRSACVEPVAGGEYARPAEPVPAEEVSP